MSDIATALRPQKFEEMLGMEKLVEKIRGHFAKHHPPSTWMFFGPTGVGKTTIARIMAVSVQCRHKPIFGTPCSRCRKNRKFFDIVEINASETTGKEDVEKEIEGAHYVPKPGSRRRVYILDEAHHLSRHSQNLLLKYFEDCPKTTVWMICTTEPDKILSTLRGRCTSYQVPSLGQEDITKLVKRGLKYCDSDRNVGDLVEQLMLKGITGGRNILRAVQKYGDTDATPEEAAEFGIVSDIDTHTLCRAVYTGDWEGASKLLQDINNDEVPKIRGAVAGYLKAVLMGESEFNGRGRMLSDSIIKMYEIKPDVAPFVAVLYKVCRHFAKG